MTMRANKRVRVAGSVFAAMLAALAGTTASAQVTVTWTGGGGDGRYSNPANWNPQVVPLNAGADTYRVVVPNNVQITLDAFAAEAIAIQELDLGTGATIITRPGRSLTVVGLAEIRGNVDATLGGSFIATGVGTSILGNSTAIPTFRAGNNGLTRVGALTYSMTPIRYGNFTIAAAETFGTVDLSSLVSLNAGWNDQDGTAYATTVSATTSGVVNLSGVQTLTTPARTEDRIDFSMASGGVINLNELQQITGGGSARFLVPLGATYSLPALTEGTNLQLVGAQGSTINLPALVTLSNANWQYNDLASHLNSGDSRNRRVTLGNNATVNAANLASMASTRIELGQGASFNAPNLTSFTFGHLALGQNGTLTTGALTNIDNSTIHLSGSRAFGVSTDQFAATSYTMTGFRYGNATVFSAEGNGTTLDLSSLTAFNAGWQDSDGTVYVTTIAASNGGVVNLSGVQTLTTPARSEDRIDFSMTAGGSINLAGLQQINGGGSARFLSAVGETFSLPALADGTNLQLVAAQGSSVNMPALVTVSNANWQNDDLGTHLNTGDSRLRRLTLGDNATLNAPNLASMRSTRIELGDGASFNAPALTSMTFGYMVLNQNGSIDTGAMTNIDNTVIHLSGGRVFGVSAGHIGATTYSMTGYRYGNGTIFSADGNGTRLDLSTLTAFNAGWQDSDGNVYVTTVSASNNGVVDLSSVQTLTVPARSEDRIDLSMTSGGVINLNALQQTPGGGSARFLVPQGATYALPALTNGTNFQLVAGQGSTVNLPVMQALSNANYQYGDLNQHVGADSRIRRLALGDGATLNAPNLTSLTSTRLELAGGSIFNAPSLASMNYGYLRLSQPGTLVFGPLTNLDHTAIHLSGGTVFGVGTDQVAATSYSMTGYRYGNDTLFSADGTGTTLDLSSLTHINGGWNDSDGNVYTTTIAATNGGTVDLSGVQTLTATARNEDRFDLSMSAGGTINLNGLQQINGSGWVRFLVPQGATYALPALQDGTNLTLNAAQGATINLPSLITLSNQNYQYNDVGSHVNSGDSRNRRLTLAEDATINAPLLTTMTSTRVELSLGAAFNAPNLTTMTFGFLNLNQHGSIDTGVMTNIDHTAIYLSNGRTFGVSTGHVGATSYSMSGYRYGNGTIFSADGPGTTLDLSSLTTFNAGWHDSDGNAYVTTVAASNNGTINLSGVQTLTTPARGEDRIDFVASAGGVVDLRALRVVNGGGQARFAASGGGVIRIGDLVSGSNVNIALTDPASTLTVDRTLLINSGSLSVTAGATMSVGKHLLHRITAEASFQATTGIFEFAAPGVHFMEIAGLDLGPLNPGNNGNFGIGRLVLGDLGAPATLQLTDLYDNGNRGQNLPEALYIYGIGQATDFDALVLRGGSTLYIDNLNVYVRENGTWLWLNGLFGPGQTVVPYAGGFLHLPTPGAGALLIGLGLMAARRRR